jgi:hypothetical protein
LLITRSTVPMETPDNSAIFFIPTVSFIVGTKIKKRKT